MISTGEVVPVIAHEEEEAASMISTGEVLPGIAP